MTGNHNKGFTLIEVVIAIALFSILVAIAAGGFTNALRAQREISSFIGAESNASLALEQMAREARTGYLFCHDVNGALSCSTQCALNGTVLTCPDLNFYNAQTEHVDYSVTNGTLIRTDQGVATAITGDNVVVKYLTFTIFGNQEDDHWNPRITITMGVSPNSTDPAAASDVVNLQTTVSAREIDCNVSGC